jgi:hypothetical protein
MMCGAVVGPWNPVGADPDAVFTLEVFTAGEDVELFIGTDEDPICIVNGIFKINCAEKINERMIAIAPMMASAGIKNFIFLLENQEL